MEILTKNINYLIFIVKFCKQNYKSDLGVINKTKIITTKKKCVLLRIF